MNERKEFPGGVWPVMLTPFTKEKKIDEAALAELTEWYICSGVKGLFAACQSSEIFYLNLEERLKITEITVKTAAGRVPVIASGNTSESLEEQAKELNAMWDLGVDAVILLSNRLAKQEESQEIWIENLHKLLAMLNPEMKLGIYECPYPYKRVIGEAELNAMLETDRFYFVKDTCCDAEIIRRKLRQTKNSKIQIFNANTSTLLESLRDGADGYCGVMANFHPAMYVWLCDHIHHENAEKVSALLTMNSLIERQLYPTNAKWHLGAIEGLSLMPYARNQECMLLTDTFKKEIRMMHELTQWAYRSWT